MRSYLECLPCIVSQALDAVQRVTAAPAVHEQLLRETLMTAARMSFDSPPPVVGAIIHRRLRELTGDLDPYHVAKERANAFAMSLYPDLSQLVAHSRSPFITAVKLAIAGNVIDLGVKSGLTESDIRAALDESLENGIDRAAVGQLAFAIRRAHDILYLADNAGEIVFDRLLIEQMPREKVTLVVRGGPIINDATLKDADAAGLTGLVSVMDNGSEAPGTILEQCSAAFRKRFETSDLIIAKGQGNYETLSGCGGRRIFFLLKVKCGVVARDLRCEVGKMVIHRGEL